ncbi:unnamed protein product [Effrenium voratum]|nr:unnamed protein product [Effrenium voratum]
MLAQRTMEFPGRAVLGAQRPVLHLVGGHDGRGQLSRCWRMDPRSGDWQEAAPLPSARSMAAAAALGGRLYVAGGFDGGYLRDVEVFDPAWNCWSAGPAMLQKRGGLALVALRGQLFACGGKDEDAIHRSAEAFQLPRSVSEPPEGAWRALPALSSARCYPAARRVFGAVWLCGGLSRAGILKSTEFLALDADRWQPGPEMLFARASAAAADLRMGLMVCGGCTQEGPLDTAEILTPDGFQLLPQLGGFRSSGTAALAMAPSCAAGEFFRQRVLIFGGFNGKKHLKSVEAFNEERCCFELAGELPEAVLGVAAAAVCMPLL